MSNVPDLGPCGPRQPTMDGDRQHDQTKTHLNQHLTTTSRTPDDGSTALEDAG